LLVASSRRRLAAARQGMAPVGPDARAFRVTAVAPVVRIRHGQGLCAGQKAPRRPPRPPAPQALESLASGSIPAAPGPPACDRELRRGQLARALGLSGHTALEDAPARPR